MGRKSDAKENLISVAQMLFWERSYTSVSVDEICDLANVNKGSFYYFFDSKQELLIEVMQSYKMIIEEAMNKVTADEKKQGFDVLDDFFNELYTGGCLIQKKTGRVLGCPIGHIAMELSSQDKVVQSKAREVFDMWSQFYEKVIIKAQKKGKLNAKINARVMGQEILAVTQGALLLAKTYNDPSFIKILSSSVKNLLSK